MRNLPNLVNIIRSSIRFVENEKKKIKRQLLLFNFLTSAQNKISTAPIEPDKL